MSLHYISFVSNLILSFSEKKMASGGRALPGRGASGGLVATKVNPPAAGGHGGVASSVALSAAPSVPGHWGWVWTGSGPAPPPPSATWSAVARFPSAGGGTSPTTSSSLVGGVRAAATATPATPLAATTSTTTATAPSLGSARPSTPTPIAAPVVAHGGPVVVSFSVPRVTADASAVVASGAPGPSAPAAAQAGNVMLERKWSPHDATNAILHECGIARDAYPNSLEEWGMAQRKVIYKMWMAHVSANRANRTTICVM